MKKDRGKRRRKDGEREESLRPFPDRIYGWIAARRASSQAQASSMRISGIGRTATTPTAIQDRGSCLVCRDFFFYRERSPKRPVVFEENPSRSRSSGGLNVRITIISAGRQRAPVHFRSTLLRDHDKLTKPVRAIEASHAASTYEFRRFKKNTFLTFIKTNSRSLMPAHSDSSPQAVASKVTRGKKRLACFTPSFPTASSDTSSRSPEEHGRGQAPPPSRAKPTPF